MCGRKEGIINSCIWDLSTRPSYGAVSADGRTLTFNTYAHNHIWAAPTTGSPHTFASRGDIISSLRLKYLSPTPFFLPVSCDWSVQGCNLAVIPEKRTVHRGAGAQQKTRMLAGVMQPGLGIYRRKKKRCYKEKITSVCPSSRHLGDKPEEDERDLPQLDSWSRCLGTLADLKADIKCFFGVFFFPNQAFASFPQKSAAQKKRWRKRERQREREINPTVQAVLSQHQELKDDREVSPSLIIRWLRWVLMRGMNTDADHQAGAFVPFIPGWDCWLKSLEPKTTTETVQRTWKAALTGFFPLPQYIHLIYILQFQDVAQPWHCIHPPPSPQSRTLLMNDVSRNHSPWVWINATPSSTFDITEMFAS